MVTQITPVDHIDPRVVGYKARQGHKCKAREPSKAMETRHRKPETRKSSGRRGGVCHVTINRAKLSPNHDNSIDPISPHILL